MDIGTILIIAIVCAVIGYVAGVLVSNLKPNKEQPDDRLREVITETTRVEVARLVRSDPRAPLQVEMEGKLFPNAAGMGSIQRQALEETTVELLKWLGYSSAVHTYPEPQPELAVAAAHRKTGPLDPSIGVPPAPKPVKEQPKSIVLQINDILQEKLEGTSLEERHIRLSEMPNQGVMVHVGLNQYTGIEDVPEEEIRQLIRESVSDWENSR